MHRSGQRRDGGPHEALTRPPHPRNRLSPKRPTRPPRLRPTLALQARRMDVIHSTPVTEQGESQPRDGVPKLESAIIFQVEAPTEEVTEIKKPVTRKRSIARCCRVHHGADGPTCRRIVVRVRKHPGRSPDRRARRHRPRRLMLDETW